MDVKSTIFFTCTILLTVALTSTTRTAKARLRIFGVLTANVLLEKMIVSMLAPGGGGDGTDVAFVMGWLWRCRKTACIIAGIVLLHAAYCLRIWLARLFVCSRS